MYAAFRIESLDISHQRGFVFRSERDVKHHYNHWGRSYGSPPWSKQKEFELREVAVIPKGFILEGQVKVKDSDGNVSWADVQDVIERFS